MKKYEKPIIEDEVIIIETPIMSDGDVADDPWDVD